MSRLDYENIESTYESIEQITGISRTELTAFLRGFDFDSWYDNHPEDDRTGDEVLLEAAQREFGLRTTFEQFCWFHITRVPEDSDFSQGLLSLHDNLERIWNMLFSLVDDIVSIEEWNAFRSRVETDYPNRFAYLYRMKSEVGSFVNSGPCAFPIRSIAMSPRDCGVNDFFDMPEIVKDICICFDEIYQIDLESRYRACCSPCVVKFVENTSRVELLGVGLFYLHKYLNGESAPNITCFNNRGISIAVGRILKVEFPVLQVLRRDNSNRYLEQV